MIGGGVRAEDGNLESILPVRLAVAGGAVATEAAHQRQHVTHIIHRSERCGDEQAKRKKKTHGATYGPPPRQLAHQFVTSPRDQKTISPPIKSAET
jgi:hypothetical protein